MTADAVGGVWRYALELARALAARGVEVTLATMGPRPSASLRIEAHEAGVARVVSGDFALEWMPDPWRDVEAAGRWLLGLEQRFEPDVVHLNGYAHAALPWDTPVVVVAHSDVLSWWEAVRGEPAPPEWRRYRRVVARGLEAADVVVAPTRAMLAALERHYAFSGERHVIANGLAARPRRSRPKEPLVLGAGRYWDEAKNLAALERVAPRVRWPVRVIGEGAPHGHVSRAELDDLLARATIFAAPAFYEPFGLAALEAASAGCALVLGNLPSQRELWSDAALFVPPGDDEALVATLTLLIRDEGLRVAYARAAEARAADYDVERTAAAYLALYDRVRAPEEAAA
jgi:glycosyltransferase involved in cell wall biosynthesis